MIRMPTIETEHGKVVLTVPDRTSYYQTWTVHVHGTEAGVEVSVTFPDRDADADELKDGVRLRDRSSRYGGLTGAELAEMATLYAVVSDWDRVWRAANVEAIEAAEREADRLEAEAEKARLEREAVMKGREQRLLTEFLGETVRVRERGYKGMARAVVEAREKFAWSDETGERVPTGEWSLYLRYINKQRSGQVAMLPRLDVQVGGKFQNVWDDGKDDLNPWDRGPNEVKKYDGGL